MAAPITKLRIGLQPDTPEEHTRLLINVNTEEAQTALQISTDLRVRANPATAKIYYYNYDGSELLYTETIEPGANGSWDGEPGRASTQQYEFIFNGWSTEPDQVDPTEDATAGVYSARRVYAAYKRRDISGFLKITGISALLTSTSSPTWDGQMLISSDAVNWVEWDGRRFASGAEKTLFLRGSNNRVVTGSAGRLVRESAQNYQHTVSGSVEFLLDWMAAIRGEHPQMGSYCFANLFSQWNDFDFDVQFPAVNLSDNCYLNVFRGCSSLSRSPDLPATELAQHCYDGMFYGCTSMTSPPNLPATSLESYCYARMLEASGIESPPTLPAADVPYCSYQSMLEDCKNLKTPPLLPALTIGTSSYEKMLRGCTALESPPNLPAKTIRSSAYAHMLDGCTKIKVSEDQDSEYSIAYQIPDGGGGTAASVALESMFANTGGTFKGTPVVNRIYYLAPPASA